MSLVGFQYSFYLLLCRLAHPESSESEGYSTLRSFLWSSVRNLTIKSFDFQGFQKVTEFTNSVTYRAILLYKDWLLKFCLLDKIFFFFFFSKTRSTLSISVNAFVIAEAVPRVQFIAKYSDYFHTKNKIKVDE